MTYLTKHFSLEELSFSELALRQGFDNTVPKDLVANLVELADVLLEPARTLLGVPLHINSGYRSHEVNSAIGGAANSAHMEGRAADFVPIGRDVLEAFHDLRVTADLPYDQLIFECGSWIHIAIAPGREAPRREALLASGKPGAWHYEAVA